ncbi:hypothetical protein Tco_0421527 [Tanacetum coccineum]
MFCVAMTDVAKVFGVPTYIYFTSPAAMPDMVFYVQAKHDEGEHDITKFKDSDLQLPIPSYVNVVPVKILPAVVFDMEGGFEWFLYLARKFRETQGILVNTFQELESHAINTFVRNKDDIPPVSVVGPILNTRNITENSTTHEEIMTWLSNQPESSNIEYGKDNRMGATDGGVVPLFDWRVCFALWLELSIGEHMVWAWLPIAAWPLYAKQQLNAFKLVVDMGIAMPIEIDYGTDMSVGI